MKNIEQYFWHTGRELRIPVESRERALYRTADPACKYHAVRWPDELRRGRGKFGEFPLVVAREYFRNAGYVVLASEPLLGDEGFICISYPGKRRAHDASYRRMEGLFGSETLAQLNALTDMAKRQLTGKAGRNHGGDPDLFAYRADDPQDRFFVEVKDHDHLTNMQKATFPIIHKLCSIIVARIEECAITAGAG